MPPERKTSRQDAYALHRCALAPLLPDAPEDALAEACGHAVAMGEKAFAAFLLQQGLGPLWDECLYAYPGDLPLSRDVRNVLHDSRLHATGDYLIQRHNLTLATQTLEGAGIPHVVTKGCHTRELYYDNAALRPAVDMDILVAPENRVEAIRAFQAGGFAFMGVARNISHECGLVKGKTTIDLHWDILRPGRTRYPMVAELLAGKVDYNSHWGLNQGADLSVMLIHPVFAKYSTTPQASLMRLVDLAQLLHRHPDSSREAETILRKAGLASAGWITLSWLHLLTGNERAETMASRLSPGRLRQKYLKDWLAHNRASRLQHRPMLVQLGFTLPAHDEITDALRALRQARRCRREAEASLAALQRQIKA